MSEVRLIDANALKYKNLAEVNGRLTYVLTAEEIDNALTVVENGLIAKDYIQEKMFFVNRESDNQPIAVISVSDLVAFEIPKGKWVKSKDGYTRCDQCGSRGSAIKARFCHHCGADMRGKEE